MKATFLSQAWAQAFSVAIHSSILNIFWSCAMKGVMSFSKNICSELSFMKYLTCFYAMERILYKLPVENIIQLLISWSFFYNILWMVSRSNIYNLFFF